MNWVQSGDAWFGRVTEADIEAQAITAHDPKWGRYGSEPHLPPIGTEVEIRIIRRSPYWALVDDE